MQSFQTNFKTNEFIEEFMTLWKDFQNKIYGHSRFVTRKDCVKFCKLFSKQELATIKMYWNNYICIEFWKYYQDIIHYEFEKNSIFILFSVNARKSTYFELQPIPFETIESEKVISLKHRLFQSQNLTEISFFKKFQTVNTILRNSFLDLYENFRISRQIPFVDKKHTAQKLEVNWLNLYSMIDILENGLFYNEKKKIGFITPINKILFSPNYVDLIIYLKFLLSNQKKIVFEDLVSFLKRQREYNLKNALHQTFVETNVKNQHQELLFYDEREEVVKLGNIPKKLKQDSEEISRLLEIDMLERKGCPFARSKGLEKNSLMEYNEYFDFVYLEFLLQNKEFKELFLK